MPDELSDAEKRTFGADAKRHLVTGMVLEQGVGHLSDNAQAELHCRIIDRRDGRDVGNEMRRKCGLLVAEDITGKAAEAATNVQPPKGE